MATNATMIMDENEGVSPPPTEETTDFDDNTLKAIVGVYMNQGNEEYSKDDFRNAAHFYTEGINANCKDEELNAKLYSNRGTVQFLRENYCDSLSDATAATELQPTHLKAIVIGASACAHLYQFKEAIKWCDKGLGIDKDNQYFLELRTRCVEKQNKLQETDRNKAANQSETQSETGTVNTSSQQTTDSSSSNVHITKHFSPGVKALSCHSLHLDMAKEMGDKTREGAALGNLGHAYQVLGVVKKAMDCYKEQLRIAKEVGDKTAEGRAYGNIGNAYQCLGDFKTAADYHVGSLRIAREVMDKRAEGAACGNIGKAYQSLGDVRKAMIYHRRHLKIAKDVGDKAGQGTAIGHLGNAYQSLGDFKMAVDYHSEQLKIAKNIGKTTVEAHAYGGLGSAYQGLGNFKEAIEYHRRHLIITKDVGDKSGMGPALGLLGNAYHGIRDFKMAMEYHEKHVTTAKETGDKAGEGTAYGNLGNVFQDLGDYAKAIECHSLHLSTAKEVGDRSEEGRAYENLGKASQGLGDFVKAIDYHELHLSIANKMGDKAGEGTAYSHIGSAYQGLGDFKIAAHYHKLHLKIAKDLGNKKMEGAAYGNLSKAYLSLGGSRKAIDYHRVHLAIAKEVGDRAEEGAAYGNLGRANHGLSDFQKAIDYHSQYLNVSKEIGNKTGEGVAYSQLGKAYQRLSDFQKALYYHNLHLAICQEMGDKAGKATAHGSIGVVYQSLGDVHTAIEHHNLHLEIAKEVGDQGAEAAAYGHLGNAFIVLGKYRKAVEYFNRQLSIAINIGDTPGERAAYGNFGNAWQKLGAFRKAMYYHYLHLRSAKEAEDDADEGVSCGHLGIVFQRLGNFDKAIHYQTKQLRCARKVRDQAGEGNAYHALSCSFESQCLLHDAQEYSQLSVEAFNNVRSLLQSEDKWKIDFRKKCNDSYTALTRILLKQERIVEALFAAETGRAQALSDLLVSQYDLQESQTAIIDEETYMEKLSFNWSSIVFLVISPGVVDAWVLFKGKDIHYSKKELDGATTFESLMEDARRNIDSQHFQDSLPSRNSHKTRSDNPLVSLYNNVIGPIADLVQGDELIIVPDGLLWLAPYAAFVDGDSKYLSESFRIRLIPSLTSLKLIAECPESYHKRNGVLLVGDPWVDEITLEGKRKISPLPFARKEVEMIGKILKVTPLVGKEATKAEVLKRLGSVALVHIAANIHNEHGEIVLSPNLEQASCISKPEECCLTMEDVSRTTIRARLIVLSCSHSARGEINPEGVVGIARAFMGAGARSVLVSQWNLHYDENMLIFMEIFYRNLKDGKSASESLNQSMKSLRESEKYNDVKYWAPFVLIGDDVKLDFEEKTEF